MAEKIETLKCPRGHLVDVHYEDTQQADHWQCPECVADPDVSRPTREDPDAVDETRVPFKRSNR